MTHTTQNEKQLKEATAEMWDMYDEHNQNHKELNLCREDLKRMKKGLSEAVIAFGFAIKQLQNEINNKDEKIKELQEDINNHNRDFFREFKINHWEVSWSKRK